MAWASIAAMEHCLGLRDCCVAFSIARQHCPNANAIIRLSWIGSGGGVHRSDDHSFLFAFTINV